MKTIRETGAELSVGKRRLEEAAEDAAKHEVRDRQKALLPNKNIILQ